MPAKVMRYESDSDGARQHFTITVQRIPPGFRFSNSDVPVTDVPADIRRALSKWLNPEGEAPS